MIISMQIYMKRSIKKNNFLSSYHILLIYEYTILIYESHAKFQELILKTCKSCGLEFNFYFIKVLKAFGLLFILREKINICVFINMVLVQWFCNNVVFSGLHSCWKMIKQSVFVSSFRNQLSHSLYDLDIKKKKTFVSLWQPKGLRKLFEKPQIRI